jgi:thiol-disulfide isomerase/thioredoxin
MLLKSLAAILFTLGCTPAGAQKAAPTAPVTPHLFTSYGTFERVPEGWRCRSIGSTAPQLLRELKLGDVLTSIDSLKLSESTPIGMLQTLRTLEFGLANSVEVDRISIPMKWANAEAKPQLLASQTSLKVLRSSLPGVQTGDILEAIGPARFTTMLTQVKNPLTSVVTVELHPGKSLRFTRDGQAQMITAREPAVVRLLQFDVDLSAQVPTDFQLGGLNTPSVRLGDPNGRWTLLHFWATWCKPCMEHVPDIRELSHRTDLTVLAIGFADSEDQLSEVSAKLGILKSFAPNVELQRRLAIVGIPFDVLVNPNGEVVLVISGNMQPEQLKSTIVRYVTQ